MTKTYTTTQPPVAVVCGSVHNRYLELFDSSSWERFDEAGLRAYIQNGAHTLVQRIESLAYSARPVSEHDRRELFFMIESFLHARTLLAPTENKVERDIR